MTTKLPEVAPDPAEVIATMRTGNLATWLEYKALELGTDNQRERHAAGLLPKDELLALARGELFKPLADFKRWTNHKSLQPHEVKHEASCAAAWNNVEYVTTDVTPLDGTAWETFKKIQHAVNKIRAHEWIVRSRATIEVAAHTHTARCKNPACRAHLTKHSVRVSIPWTGGHTLVREFAL